jgi:hypothetical protein
MSDALKAWLGPAADDLTPEQIERVAEAARDIDRRYPDPDDEDKRQAALSATVQYLLGEITPEDASRALVEARRREREAYVAALQVAVLMVRDGGGKKPAADACGIDRMGLLKALGERVDPRRR